MTLIDGLRACYLAVSLCTGVKHPPKMPHIEIVPNVPHVSAKGVPNSPGFACGTYLDGSTAYCTGLYDSGWVVVSTNTLYAIPHEFIHYIVAKKKLWRTAAGDKDDSGHQGPWWKCEKKAAIPACAGLFP